MASFSVAFLRFRARPRLQYIKCSRWRALVRTGPHVLIASLIATSLLRTYLFAVSLCTDRLSHVRAYDTRGVIGVQLPSDTTRSRPCPPPLSFCDHRCCCVGQRPAADCQLAARTLDRCCWTSSRDESCRGRPGEWLSIGKTMQEEGPSLGWMPSLLGGVEQRCRLPSPSLIRSMRGSFRCRV